jgi:hypothetical protein
MNVSAMNAFLGPLDESGRFPARQQTRVAAFLMSAHGAQARQLAATLSGAVHDGWQVEMHVQFCREMEILSLLARATSWTLDPQLPFLMWQWESAWLPRPAEGIADRRQGLLIDIAALGHALHGGMRTAALLPEDAHDTDPFTLAMRRIEFEGARLMQGQVIFLKGAQFHAVRAAVNAAVERRHAQVRELWDSMLRGIDVDNNSRHLAETAFQVALRTNALYQASLQGGAGTVERDDKVKN